MPCIRRRALGVGLVLLGWMVAWPLPQAATPVCDRARMAAWTDACLRAAYTADIAHWPAPTIDPGVHWDELAPLPARAPAPADNPTTAAKVALGQRLFHDPRLSGSGQIACASCHDRDLGWSDGRRVSFGHDRQAGRRNAIGVRMSGHMRHLFWDGRAGSLEDQALHSLTDPREMAADLDTVLRALARTDYPDAFADAFGQAHIDARRLGQALGAFQRSLSPRNGRFDRFLRGERQLLDDRQLRGLHVFRTQGRCMNCHSGPALTNHDFHNLGLHFHGRSRQDLGRFEVTGVAADSGRFRTPSLRGVARTAPYMHNGLFPHLRGVLTMYNAGMPRPRSGPQDDPDSPVPQPDPLLQPLGLSAEDLAALEAFLLVL